MRKIVALIICLFLVILTPQTAFADVEQELTEQVADGLGNLDFSAVEDIGESYVGSVVDKIQKIINGEYDNAETFLQLLWQVISSSLSSLFPQLVSIFVILVLVGLVRKTSGGFISQSTDEIVSFVGNAVVTMTVISLTIDVYLQVSEILDKVSSLANASLPIILTLMVANASSSLSTVCQPSMVMFSGLIINLVRQIILPLSASAMSFSFVSNLSSNVKLTKMTTFLNNTASWILGIVFTVFSAFTSVQGVSASALDGVGYRMAKFSAKNYIPILGGYVADGFDVVVASTSLIKNAFGVVLLAILLMMIVKPLLTIICLNLGFQGVTAIAEPIVDDNSAKVFSGVCKSLTFLSALVVAVAFMFGILIFIAISCANGVQWYERVVDFSCRYLVAYYYL